MTIQNHDYDFYLNYGTVVSLIDGVAGISGLRLAQYGELLLFPEDKYGLILSMKKSLVQAILFGKEANLSYGDKIYHTFSSLKVYAGSYFLGGVINSIGNFIDKVDFEQPETKDNIEKEIDSEITKEESIEDIEVLNNEITEEIEKEKYLVKLVEKKAPSIMDRLPIVKSMVTGIKSIDSLFPIGKGQRQLILGDRQTGKTTIALLTILHQARLHS
jgi:F-type H+-transporting ATPase subunit alpha